MTATVFGSSKDLSNRERVVGDAADPSPKTQAHVPRAASPQEARRALDAALVALNAGEVHAADARRLSRDAKVAAKAIASRLCAPRDMGAPAAAALRHVLLRLADS